jgi:hypothetical protein
VNNEMEMMWKEAVVAYFETSPLPMDVSGRNALASISGPRTIEDVLYRLMCQFNGISMSQTSRLVLSKVCFLLCIFLPNKLILSE